MLVWVHFDLRQLSSKVLVAWYSIRTVSKAIRVMSSWPVGPWVAGAQPSWLGAPPPPDLVDGDGIPLMVVFL